MLLTRTVALILAILTATPALAVDKQVSAEDRYQQCLRQMRRGYYTKALEQCNRVRNFHRDDPVSVLAELAIADIYFKRGEYEQARLAYEDFARLHPRHRDLDYVTFRIGLSIYRRAPKMAGRDQTGTRQAVNVWTAFDRRFPDSEHKDDANKYLGRARDRLALKELNIARFYAKRDAWDAVRARADGVTKKYADSKHMPRALRMIGESHHRWGEVDQAKQVRDRLAADHATHAELRRLDRILATTPGEKPEEELFVRPYRYPGMNAMGPGP